MRRFWILLLAAFGLFAGFGGVASAATNSSSLSGTVITTGGQPLSEVYVSVSQVGKPDIVDTSTDSDGRWSIAGLAAGDYEVWFDVSRSSGGSSPAGYLDEDPAHDPREIQLGEADHQTISEVDPPAAGLTGTIRDRFGNPVSYVPVEIEGSHGDAYRGDAGGEADGQPGVYEIVQLPPGKYTVCFRPDYLSGTSDLKPQCFDKVALTGSPTPVMLTGGSETKIDATLTAVETPPGDFNGDGRSDRAVWRPSNGTWYDRGQSPIRYGMRGDIPVAGDYDGDGKTDRAVWRPSDGTWYVRGQARVRYGIKGDVPVPCDYDGDGKVDRAVWRPSDASWYIRGHRPTRYGNKGDTPVPADYFGDNKCELAVWRSSASTWFLQGQASLAYTGYQAAVPTPGDFVDDSGSDRMLWRPSDGLWFPGFGSGIRLGRSGDIPVVGDYAGSRKLDRAVWRPSSGTWYVQDEPAVRYGIKGDIPV